MTTKPIRWRYWVSNPKVFPPPFGGTALVVENFKVVSVGQGKEVLGWAIGRPWPEVRERLKQGGFKLKSMGKPGPKA